MKLLVTNQLEKMTWGQVMFTIMNDVNFENAQNGDPDFLMELDYFEKLPQELIDFCFYATAEQTEPYFEDVLSFVFSKMIN